MKNKCGFGVGVMLSLLTLAVFIFPEAWPASLLAVWAWFGIVLLTVGSLAGITGELAWYVFERGEVKSGESKSLNCIRAFYTTTTPPLLRLFHWLLFALNVIALWYAGWTFTALLWLICRAAFLLTGYLWRLIVAEDNVCIAA